MADQTWEITQTRYCDHIQLEVNLEAQRVYPADFLPDLSIRVTGHRCSHGMECNLFEQHACIWSGTQPAHDPFQQ